MEKPGAPRFLAVTLRGFASLAALAVGVPAGGTGGPPHRTGREWLDPSSRGFHGRSTIACVDCHDEASECRQCHFGPGGGREPPGARWTHGVDGHEHLWSYEQVCRRCHDLRRQWGGGPGRCHDCHAGRGDGEREGPERRGGRERGKDRDDGGEDGED